MKKSVIGVMSVAALGLFLTACGNNAKSNDGKSDEKETITYALWDKSQAPVYEEIAKNFEKDNPDISVKFEITPWGQYWTKLETAITGKNAPDVFWMNIPRVIDYVDNGILEPLDDVEFDKDKIPEQYLEAYSSDDKLYGVPKDFDTNGLWYNKKIFDDAGIAYPDETWTWEKWQEVALALTDKEKGIYGMAVPATWQGGYYDTMYQNGGSPFTEDGKKSNFTDEASIEGVEFWYSFVKDGSGTPIELITNTNQMELMLSEKVAMAVDGSYQTPVFFEEEYGKENIDVAPLPQGKVRATTSNGLANVVSADSKHKEAAKKWIAYLTTEGSMKHVAESGTVIPVYEGSQDAWVNAYPDKNLQVFVDAVEYAVPLPNYKNSSAATAIEQDPINRAWTGEITVKEACEEIAKKADEILQQ